MPNTKPKTAIFSLLDSPVWGGGEQYLTDCLQTLDTQADVYLATNLPAPHRRQLSTYSWKIMDLPFRLDLIGDWKGFIKFWLLLLPTYWWLWQQLRQLRAAGYTHIVCLWPGFSERLALTPLAKLMGCKIIWLEYGPLATILHQASWWNWAWYRLTAPMMDRVVTISQSSLNSILQTKLVPAEKISLVYPGVQIPESKNEISRKPTFTICSVGRIAKEKNFELILKALSQLPPTDLKRIQVLIVGDGPARPELEALTQQLKLTDSVTFTGFVSAQEKSELLQKSNLFIFTGNWQLEGFGMTTAEAMAHGLPVITTGSGPQKEIVIPDRHGLHFDPSDSQDLAKKISWCLHHQKQLGEWGRAAKRRVEKDFSHQKFSQQILAVVEPYLR